MRWEYSAIVQKLTAWYSVWSMVVLLLLLAPSARGGGSASSPQPHLNTKRLLRAYTPYRRGIEPTLKDLTWSRDGNHAFYTVYEEPNSQGHRWYTLFAVRRNGSHIHKLYGWKFPGENAPEDIRWSPDSSRIIMLILNYSPASSENADGVHLIDINPETQETRRLSRDLGGHPGSGYILNRPGYYTFSPNGKYLLLTLGGDRQYFTNKRLVRIDYATGKRKLLTPYKMAVPDACWSPDGRHIVYTALPDLGRAEGTPTLDWETEYERRVKQQHLYMMDAVGGHKRLLAAKNGFREEKPYWAAKGRTLFFARRRITPDAPRSLWTVHPDGSGAAYVRALAPSDD